MRPSWMAGIAIDPEASDVIGLDVAPRRSAEVTGRLNCGPVASR